MPDQTFQKEERLKSKKTLARLFKEGRSFSAYPIRVVWLPIEATAKPVPFQFTVSVPKKKFPKAVDRNRIKRQIREAYRLNKHILFERFAGTEPFQQYGMMMIYISKEKEDYALIEKNVIKIINRLIRKLAVIKKEG